MAHEQGATIIGGLEAALKGIHDELSAFRLDTHGGLSRLEGMQKGFKLAFEQMDMRLSTIQWEIGLVVVIQIFTLGKLFVK